MAGWIPTPADGWPLIAEALSQPWPEAAAVTDLRWWVDQRGEPPGRPTLAARWGWSDWAVRRLLADEARWKDPLKGGISSAPPAPLQVPSNSSTGEPAESTEILQRPSSVPPASLHTRVDPHSPSPSQKTDVIVRPLEVWNTEVVPAARARGGRPAIHSASTKAVASALRQRVTEHGEQAVLAVMRWYGSSTSSRARFLREGGHGLTTLLRPAHFEEYLAMAGPEPPSLPLQQRVQIAEDLPPLVPAAPPASNPTRRRRQEFP